MTLLSPAADAVMVRSANAIGVLSLVIFMRSTPLICRGARPVRREHRRTARMKRNPRP
jgi:hypothetical protein